MTNHIIYLNLEMNNVRVEGAHALSQAIQFNESLINLNLSSGKRVGNNRNRILEEGAFHLAKALSSNNYLMILNLSGNSIGNEGLIYLIEGIQKQYNHD